MSEWAELREKYDGKKPKGRPPYDDRQICGFAESGFRLASAEMEALYGELSCDLYWDARQSTYPLIKDIEPSNGIYHYGTHDRSENISEAIDKLADMHKADIEAGTAWLMPVTDDEEYVSWELDIIVGTEAEVLETLRRAIPS